MTEEPTLFLIVQELQRLERGELSLDESDFERMTFEQFLSDASEQQPAFTSAALTRAYLGLSDDKWQALPPNLHLWFLERICRNTESFSPDVTRLIDLYFELDHDTCEVYVTYALLAMIEKGDSDLPDKVCGSWWQKLVGLANISPEEITVQVEDFAEILVDTNTPESLAMLLQLSSCAMGHLGASDALRGLIDDRKVTLGEECAGDLLELLEGDADETPNERPS